MGVKFDALQPGYRADKAQAKYDGGKHAPRADQLSAEMQSYIRGGQGINEKSFKEEDVKHLLESGWTYGKPAPHGFEYNDKGLLQKDSSKWKTVGKVAAIGGAAAATYFTGGATSPWLAAAIGAGSGAALAAANGGNWKQILLGAGIGGVTGGAGSAVANSTLNAGTKAALQAGIGAAPGAVQGNAKQALLGGVTGAGGSLAGNVAQRQATQGVSSTNQLLTQAGIHAALGGATGGPQGALMGAGQGAANNALYQQKFRQYQQQQQRPS